MVHVKAFLIGIFIICIGIYFGDPVSQEFSIDLNNAMRLTEDIHCLNTETEREGYCASDMPIKTGKLIK
jgi:hypothetical protein